MTGARPPTAMRGRCVGLLCLGLAGTLGVLAAGAAPRVDVYTVSGQPVTQVPDRAHVVELDKPARLDHRLSTGLPANKQAAAAVVRERLSHFKAAYGRAYRGLTRAYQLGVTKVPAVVVDGRYVVYGQSNVAKALSTVRKARSSEATP
ncbi:TIGR03757 family integrating conjugative element protein [Salinisphaera orenii]|uniref:TIGR03757 family integrating conjugative element protein n=1 Tax=Salinisphaera orenii TaxID=856731 RepID=UPI000DBE02BF